MNRKQLICLWAGMATFIAWAAYSAGARLCPYKFWPISFAILVLIGANIFTCSAEKEISKTKLIIINMIIVVIFLIFFLIGNEFERPSGIRR